MSGPLAGIRVLDLSRILAGPFCTMMLGDAGAEVVKVEPPTGDDTRRWGPPYAGGESAYYLSCNRNKRSITVDLTTEDGREIVGRLARQADVLIENFKLGSMERWSLGYEEVLRPANPGLVYCNISGFGRTGPYASVSGYDYVIQGMGGLMSITGEPEGDPMRSGMAVADLTTGMMAAFGISAALHHRGLTGEGQRVDLSLLETQVSWLANIASNYLVSGQVPQRVGNAHPNIVPYQTFAARDQAMVVAVGNDQQFQRFCDLAGLPELPTDPRYSTNSARVANRESLVVALAPVLRTRDAAEWIALLWDRGIPSGPINTIDQVFADPQVLHREMLREIPHPTAGTVKQVGLPIKFGTTPGAITRHPPLLGEHTLEVLAELGYDSVQIASLIKAGAVKLSHGSSST